MRLMVSKENLINIDLGIIMVYIYIGRFGKNEIKEYLAIGESD